MSEKEISEPSDPKKATLWGPRTGSLPVVGSLDTDALPYAGGHRRGRRRLAGAAAVLLLVGVIGVVVTQRGGTSHHVAQRPAVQKTTAPTGHQPGSGAGAARPTSQAAPTTAVPTTAVPTTAAPVPTGPLPPPHQAVYRDGKLYLEGAVPDAATGQKLFDKAAAVIGKDNVLGGYIIDPRMPPQTDGRVIVDQRFVFPTGSAVLDPNYSNILELGFIVMTQNPQVTMVINGHTDSVGDPNQNLILSQARASSVVNYYASRGIDPNRFVPIVHGSANPVAPNETEAGRAQNRRIEVTLLHLIS